MNCRCAASLISAYIDGELNGNTYQAVRGHLGNCPTCASEHAELARIKRMLGAMPAEEPSDALLDKIFAGLDDAPIAAPSGIVLDRAWPVLPEWRRNLVRYGTYAAAAAALASFFVAGNSLRRTREEVAAVQRPAIEAGYPLGSALSNEIQFQHEDWRDAQSAAYWRGSGAGREVEVSARRVTTIRRPAP